MKTLMMEQGSTEWQQARLGVVTASEIDALVSPTWKIRTGEGVETYLHKKLCEKALNWTADFGSTFAMDQGSLVEKIALPWYGFTYDCEPKRVGLCLSDDGRIGCSPDALLGDDDGLEIKVPLPPTHLKYLLKNEVPPEYLPQVHFSMYVTGRPKWTFLSYSRQFPSLVVHVKRDPIIEDTIRNALAAFFERFDARFAQISAWRAEENARMMAQYSGTRGD
jgi:hypothetical protein